jgi:hypothetical protein
MSHSKDWDESSGTSHSRDWSTAASHDRDWDESETSQDREKKSVTFPDEKAEGSEADVIIDQQVLKSKGNNPLRLSSLEQFSHTKLQ